MARFIAFASAQEPTAHAAELLLAYGEVNLAKMKTAYGSPYASSSYLL